MLRACKIGVDLGAQSVYIVSTHTYIIPWLETTDVRQSDNRSISMVGIRHVARPHFLSSTLTSRGGHTPALCERGRGSGCTNANNRTRRVIGQESQDLDGRFFSPSCHMGSDGWRCILPAPSLFSARQTTPPPPHEHAWLHIIESASG